MPFVFKPPESRTRVENPADMLLRTFKAGRIEMILGVTLPKYNGEVVDTPQCAKSLTVQSIVARNSGGYECVPERVDHEFSWDMELPPSPPWRSQQALGTEIRDLAVALDKSVSRMLSGAADFTHCTRITLTPKPNWPVIREHVYSHEMQHVCDFKWAAIKLFGPVVQMQDDYYSANQRVNCTDRDILQFVASGGNECKSIKVYENATKFMGGHYHGTNGGSAPVVTFTGVSLNGLVANFDLTQLYGTFPVSFYTGRPHQYFKVSALSVKDEIAVSDPAARPTPEFTQETVNALMSGNDNDGSGEEELTWD